MNRNLGDLIAQKFGIKTRDEVYVVLIGDNLEVYSNKEEYLLYHFGNSTSSSKLVRESVCERESK